MSISKRSTQDPKNIQGVLDTYCADDKPTVQQVADKLEIPYHSVQYILTHHLQPERYKIEKALRYSRSKTGTLNPMIGKNGSQHHNYIGDVGDGYGYLQRKVDGEYVFVHRITFAEALGLIRLPKNLVVHHIDENPTNNDLDNLALVTDKGHKK